MQVAPVIDRATQLGLRVRQLSDLPPLSPVAQRLLAMLTDERVAVSALAQTIELDPGLTARVVGLARSAFFGYSGTVYTVRDAIVRVLGLETVKSLALSLALSGHLKAGALKGFDLARYWGTALLSASCARALAPRVALPGGPTADGAYLGGLLHNLGLLAMVCVFPPEMELVLSLAATRADADLQAIEQEVLGVDHYQVGGWLADRWHLPPEIVVVLERQHEPDYRGPYWVHVRLVDACARLAEARLADAPVDTGVEAARFQPLGVPEPILQEMHGFIEERVGAIREIASSLAKPG
jgi:HD-like signal output (HDOD) protein